MLPLGILTMLLYLQYGDVCAVFHLELLHLLQCLLASPTPEVVSLLVEYGESAMFPCNGSAYLEKEEAGTGEEGEFRWEAMGEDVAFIQGGELIEGRGYEGRIQMASDDKLREGNWSLVLDSVMLRDANMYECIWQGRRTISTVWLKVNEPKPEHSLVAWLGESVLLPCYIQVSKSQTYEDLHVWWTRNGNTVASLEQGHVAIDDDDPSRFTMWTPEAMEDFGLIISPVLIHDHAEYRCLYTARSSDDPKPGIPESVTLTVLGTEQTQTVFHLNETETVTETWTNISTWMNVSTWMDMEMTTEAEAETTEPPPDPTPLLLEDSTQPQLVATTSQPMEAMEETATSFPDEGTLENGSESFQWETLPGVRIGLIAGVLVFTAVVLCILGALRKI